MSKDLGSRLIPRFNMGCKMKLFAGNWIGTVVAMLGSQGSAGMAGYGATVGLSFRIVECQDQDPIAR